MPHSHHSHSGSYCNHAIDTLPSILAYAASQNFTTYALTEHCPRSNLHLYPGEESNWDSAHQYSIFDTYVSHANRLREEYAAKRSSMKVLVGFEAEWIEPASSAGIVRELLMKYEGRLDYFVGSVHHVCAIPIDFDQAHYDKAVQACGGEVQLFERYFDDQFQMLRTLRPKVIGHFDLIRLLSSRPDPEGGWEKIGDGEVWRKIVRNLEFVVEYGGVLEVNTSALRKGLKHPYPREEIVRKFDEMGGLLVLSDDSHGLSHVGTNYGKALEFTKKAGLKHIAYLDKEAESGAIVIKTMSVDELQKHPYWNS